MLNDQKIKEILLAGDYVRPEDITAGEDFVRTHHSTLQEYLLTEGLITKDLIGQAAGEMLKVPYADLNSLQPTREQVLAVPEDVARKYRLVLFRWDKKTMTLASDTLPLKPEELKELAELYPGKKISFAYALPEDIDAAFVYYRKSLETRFAKILAEKKQVAPGLVGEIFDDAIIARASDVHFEPQEKEVIVRFRIDGVLHEAGRVPKEWYENILNRIKVRAHLRIDEHYAAQDGALRHEYQDDLIDMRISIMPTIEGEKIAIRVLSQYVRSFTLADLGLAYAQQQQLEAVARKPFGMILVTGPTGSGKTTTLYALLKLLNRPEVNITTIEDPVEYRIVGINQIQVNPQTNLTFAQGLRSIVRQDPNIVLVGEIRDTETAETAVNAALTGHLLLSTIHANDAATGIPRLLDMRIEPFLLSSTLEIIVAQRLLRKICESCRVSSTVSKKKIATIAPGAEAYFPDKETTLFEGRGCEVCHGTGYVGRIGIFELIVMSQELRELILRNPSAQQVMALARKQGARSLFEDGIEKVKSGVTTLQEVMRVASANEEK